ncbi:MAG TPA: hypothetical protein VF892_13395 [Pseudonocardiaceae bacterium]
MTAEIEEDVVDADIGHAKHVSEQSTQDLLARTPRQTTLAGDHLRLRQRGTIKLAVGVDRQLLQHHISTRPQMLRQPNTHKTPQLSNINPISNNISNQTVFADHHRAPPYRGMLNHRRHNLSRLNPEPTNLHLIIRTPQEIQHPIRSPPRHIPRAIHPLACVEWVRDETLGRHRRLIQIAVRQTTGHIQLTRHTHRHRTQ